MNTPELTWSTLQQRRPFAARLALLTCLPVRVTPALVRLARLTLLPEGGTDAEADLWLSDLVQARAAGGFIYHSEVRTFLREQLRAQSALLDTVWNRVYLTHAQWLLPRIRLEEELTWRLLRDPEDEQIDALWRTVVSDLDEAPHTEGIARWVVRAMPDLPPGSLEHESGRRAFLGAHILLGDATVLGSEAQRFHDTKNFAFATRRLARQTVFVGLYEHGLLIDPMQPIRNGHAVEIPATRPLWLQVEAIVPGQAPIVITLDGDRPVQRDIDHVQMRLRLLDGSAYELQPRSRGQAADTRSGFPRVELAYNVKSKGQTQHKTLPFTVCVLGDFQGDTSAFTTSPIRSRFVDADGIDGLMRLYRPSIQLSLHSEDSTVDNIEFSSIDDFSPAALIHNVPSLRAIAELRDHGILLSNAVIKHDALARYLTGVLRNRQLLEAYASYKADPAMRGIRYQKRVLLDLLQAMAPPPSRDQEWALLQAIVALAHHVVSQPEEPAEADRSSLEGILYNLNKRLARLLGQVLRHSKFRALEASWLGLEHLLSHAPLSENLRIRITSIRKEEVLAALSSSSGSAPVDSATYHILGEELGSAALPFGCLIGDFYFDETPADIELLDRMATLCAADHIPFIAAARYRSTLTTVADVRAQPFNRTSRLTPGDSPAWRNLRARPESRYLVLTTPRFMARRPVRMQLGPDLAFNETTKGRDNSDYVWANPAYLLAASIGRSFQRYGWFAKIAGTGADAEITGLPWDEGDERTGSGPNHGILEAATSKRLVGELSAGGIASLLEQYDSRAVSFTEAPSIFEVNPMAPDMVKASTLPYLFVLCAFAHCIKRMVASNPFWDRPDVLEATINTWLASYVGQDSDVSEAAQAQFPLDEAEFRIRVAGSGAYAYEGTLSVSPRFQLSELPVRLSVRLSIPHDIFV